MKCYDGCKNNRVGNAIITESVILHASKLIAKMLRSSNAGEKSTFLIILITFPRSYVILFNYTIMPS